VIFFLSFFTKIFKISKKQKIRIKIIEKTTETTTTTTTTATTKTTTTAEATTTLFSYLERCIPGYVYQKGSRKARVNGVGLC